MESFSSTETSPGSGNEVKDYIEQEWTADGMYCRSENAELGMFEIVLPQICKDFGAFMQDLIACGIRDIEFRADSKETRLIVYTNDATVIPEYFRRKKQTQIWKIMAIVGIIAFVMTILTFLNRTSARGQDL